MKGQISSVCGRAMWLVLLSLPVVLYLLRVLPEFFAQDLEENLENLIMSGILTVLALLLLVLGIDKLKLAMKARRYTGVVLRQPL